MKVLTLACLSCALAPALAGQATQIAGGARQLKVVLTPDAAPQTVQFNSANLPQSNDLPLDSSVFELAPGCQPEQVRCLPAAGRKGGVRRGVCAGAPNKIARTPVPASLMRVPPRSPAWQLSLTARRPQLTDHLSQYPRQAATQAWAPEPPPPLPARPQPTRPTPPPTHPTSPAGHRHPVVGHRHAHLLGDLRRRDDARRQHRAGAPERRPHPQRDPGADSRPWRRRWQCSDRQWRDHLLYVSA